MRIKTTLVILMIAISSSAIADDARKMVELPAMMQEHMLANMRDHLVTIDKILGHLTRGELDKAAETAERNLGMSSLETHGASHLAQFMPQEMQTMGTNMHRAASRFALKAQEGDALAAYHSLQEITTACVACHAAYRIR